MPQTAWVSSSWRWSQLGTRCQRESQRQTEGFGPSVTHGWAAQPRWGRSAAMVTRRTLGQNNSLSPSPTHLTHTRNSTSHTQPTSTLSRIKKEIYIFIKKCVRLFIEVRYYCWLCFHIYLYMYVSIQQLFITKP